MELRGIKKRVLEAPPLKRARVGRNNNRSKRGLTPLGWARVGKKA